MNKLTVGQNIRRFRKEKNLTQSELAELLGVSVQAISKWESGTSTPELEKLLALCECFNITLDELVRDEVSAEGKNEDPQKLKENKGSNVIRMKAGVCLCLIGVVFLILFAVVSQRTTQQFNATSTITLNETGVLLIICLVSMLFGLVLILKKK